MNRRNFLKTVGAGAAVAAVGLPVVKAAEQADCAPVVPPEAFNRNPPEGAPYVCEAYKRAKTATETYYEMQDQWRRAHPLHGPASLEQIQNSDKFYAHIQEWRDSQGVPLDDVL